MFEQQYGLYRPGDHSVWSILYKRQIRMIRKVSYHRFAGGLTDLGFSEETIPDFKTVNKNLQVLTGWKIYAAPGLIPARQFFKLMVFKRFGSTTFIRKMDQLDYLEEPDMFHDLFGHIPLLADPMVCDYLHQLALIAERYIDNEHVIELVSRLYWYTIEFGLVKEKDELKIYGAGILSSPGETAYCLSAEATTCDFDLEKIINIPYIIDRFQEKYFVLSSMEQLPLIASALDNYLRKRYSE
jgi:phenylalanine-4-hydroxylase